MHFFFSFNSEVKHKNMLMFIPNLHFSLQLWLPRKQQSSNPWKSFSCLFFCTANDDISSYHNNVMHKINLALFLLFFVFCFRFFRRTHNNNRLAGMIFFDDDTLSWCTSVVLYRSEWFSALVAIYTLHVCNTRFHSFLRFHSLLFGTRTNVFIQSKKFSFPLRFFPQTQLHWR